MVDKKAPRSPLRFRARANEIPRANASKFRRLPVQFLPPFLDDNRRRFHRSASRQEGEEEGCNREVRK